MKSGIVKHSVAVSGHKTSISLEEPFWQALHEIANAEKVTVVSLLDRIDRDRETYNLSSHVRMFVLDYYRSRIRI